MLYNMAVLYPWPNSHMLEVCALGTATCSAAQGSVSLLNLFRQLCLLRDFRIIWEGESKGLFAGLSQSESTTEVQIKDLIFNYVDVGGGMGSPGVKSYR